MAVILVLHNICDMLVNRCYLHEKRLDVWITTHQYTLLLNYDNKLLRSETGACGVVCSSSSFYKKEIFFNKFMWCLFPIEQHVLFTFGYQAAGCRAQWEAPVSGLWVSRFGFKEAHGFMPWLLKGSAFSKSESRTYCCSLVFHTHCLWGIVSYLTIAWRS